MHANGRKMILLSAVAHVNMLNKSTICITTIVYMSSKGMEEAIVVGEQTTV